VRIVSVTQILQYFQPFLFRVVVKTAPIKIHTIFIELHFNLLTFFELIDAMGIDDLLGTILFHQILI
jgi:hypothetical protein